MQMHPVVTAEVLMLDRSIDLIEEGVDLAVHFSKPKVLDCCN